MANAVTLTAKRGPPMPVTWGIIAVCVVITVVLNLHGEAADKLAAIVMPGAASIWRGHVWVLLTTAFVHTAIWHIAFNMWWTRDFGRILEPTLGSAKYLAFVVAAAVVSSAWQLLVSGETGIGFSGVVYALFGYAVARRRSFPSYAAFVNPRTIAIVLGWAVLCVVLTATGTWGVANAAHFSGLAFGFAVGVVAERHRLRALAAGGIALLAIGTVMACAYMPWSARWRARATLLTIADVTQRAHDGDPAAQAALGARYVRIASRQSEGMTLLRTSATAGNANGMNTLAWTLATSSDDSLRNGAEAVQWAEKVHAVDPAPGVTDTLAAAYAEAGRWDEAIATQEKAIRDLEPDAKDRTTLEAHLATLKDHRPIRD